MAILHKLYIWKHGRTKALLQAVLLLINGKRYKYMKIVVATVEI